MSSGDKGMLIVCIGMLPRGISSVSGRRRRGSTSYRPMAGWGKNGWRSESPPDLRFSQLTRFSYSSTALVALGPHPSSPALSFTHGSLRPSYPHLLPYPSAINDLGHSLMSKALTPPLALPYPPNPYPGLPKTTTPDEAELYAEGGPFWWRGLAEMKDESLVCGWAAELKAKMGVRRIIGVRVLSLCVSS